MTRYAHEHEHHHQPSGWWEQTVRIIVALSVLLIYGFFLWAGLKLFGVL